MEGTEFKLPVAESTAKNCLAIGLISSAGGAVKGPEHWTERRGGVFGSVGTAIFSKKIPKENEKTGTEAFTQPEKSATAAMTLLVAPV